MHYHRDRVATSHKLAIRAAILAAAATSAIHETANAAGVDQFQFYFGQSTAINAGSNGIGGYTYDQANNVFWTVSFSPSQSIRKITNSGGVWTGTDYVGATAWVNQYIASTSLAGSGTVPAAPWTATNGVGNIKLNPAEITVDGITYAPGTLGIIIDPGRPTDGTTVQPLHAKEIYTYDLRQIGTANSGRDRNTNGIVDWNDVFSTVTTMADMQSVQGNINGTPVTGTTVNFARSFAFSSDGKSIFYNDSASTFGGIWKVDLTNTGSASMTKVVQALTGNRINTEPDVIPSSLRNFGGGVGDQVLFQGATDTGNDRGLSYIVDNGTQNQTANTLLTAKQIASYLDNGAQPDVAGVTHDSNGNLFITSGSTPYGVFVYDTNGRLGKVFSYAEKRVFDSANGISGTTFNPLILDMDTRSTTVNLTGGGTANLTQILFTDSTTGARFPAGVNFWKIGDFNRDNVVDGADITLFKANLGLRGVTSASITGTTAPSAAVAEKFKYDLNGDTILTGSGAAAVASVSIDWKDVKILQQFAGLSDGDVDMDFDVDSTDLSTLAASYNTTGKLFTQGNLTSVRIAATDKDTVNYADLITLAANWTAAKPAAVATGLISAANMDRAFAVTSGGTISQLTNFAGGALTWSNAANWSGGVPNGAGAVASLLTKPFNDTNISIGTDYTLGQLNFDSYFTYTISGSGHVTF